MTKVMITYSWRPWWRRLLRLPPKEWTRGPVEVHPWPASWTRNDEGPPASHEG